ncbi:NAD(P)/FAD-dependent oxidoreductase [Massilia sp. 9096]|uniref:NAD(P)/FAD-dependent oxidoreductase n=1 Tax=Massilia sp. 9096 TaxID=1500894 RepID=UPI00056A4C9C|nr:NAD(P)/FAD-dependent oxidoreductase [Massilia sp. 9096]
MQSIVIVGGGVAGLELATRLGRTLGPRHKDRVVLIDTAPTHFWKPLLHEVAAGTIDPASHTIDYARQAIDNHFTFVCGEVVQVDRVQRTLTVRSRFDDMADSHTVLDYGRLVLAYGSVTNFFGIPGAEQHCMALDSVAGAEAFRKRFLQLCDAAGRRRQAQPEANSALDIVIVGAGPTGIELAADLRQTVDTLAHYGLSGLAAPQQVRIRIVERGSQVLPSLDAEASNLARRKLEAMGIVICTDTAVAEVREDAVATVDGRVFPAAITVWAAGVKGPDFSTHLNVLLNRSNQLLVDEHLRSVSDPEIHALGDCCTLQNPDKSAIAPPSAQAARQQAIYLANLLTHAQPDALPGFKYRDYGTLVSLGRGDAVGILRRAIGKHNVRVKGTFALAMYGLTYQRHVMGHLGPVRMAANVLARWFRSKMMMPVRWH